MGVVRASRGFPSSCFSLRVVRGGCRFTGGSPQPLSLALVLCSRLHPGAEQKLRAVRLLRALWNHSAAGTRGARPRCALPRSGGNRASAQRCLWGLGFPPPEPSASARTSCSSLRSHWNFLQASSEERERLVPGEAARLWVPTFGPPSWVSFDGGTNHRGGYS